MLLRIESIPPCGVFLEVFLEPRHDRVGPEDALVVVHDTVVLALHMDERHVTAEQFQGGEQLHALHRRHVGVGCSVGEQQRRVDLVGTVERTLVDIQVTVAPWVFLGHAHLAVAVSPVAVTPITGVVADARMADGAGKQIGDGLQILRHETAIRCAHTTDMFLIDGRVLLADGLDALDDILGDALARRVDMARAMLLSETGGTTGVHHIDDIILRRIEVPGIVRLEIPGGG